MERTERAIGLVSPGEMGSSVGAAVRAAGARVRVALAGRSAATRARAAADGLEDVESLATLVRDSEIVLSVCPPAAAPDVAEAVFAHGFRGIYVEANAISPERSREIAGRAAAAGARVVDGGIVGPPARRAGTTRLYLSGEPAAEIASLFAGGPLEAIAMTGASGAHAAIGDASALKMAYAAYTKGLAALLVSVHAVARAHGVEQVLLAEWQRSQPDLPGRLERSAATVVPKAWRFGAEMREIAATFEAAGLPAGFHSAAAQVYDRLAAFEDRASPPTSEQVADALPLRGDR